MEKVIVFFKTAVCLDSRPTCGINVTVVFPSDSWIWSDQHFQEWFGAVDCWKYISSISRYIYSNLADFTLPAPPRHCRPVNRKNKQMKSNNTLPEFPGILAELHHSAAERQRATAMRKFPGKNSNGKLLLGAPLIILLLLSFVVLVALFWPSRKFKHITGGGGEKKTSFGGSRLPSWARSDVDNSKHGKCARRN